MSVSLQWQTRIFHLMNVKFLVCDDCFEDNLEVVINKFCERIPKIRLLRQREHKGPTAARNIGFLSSNADIYVCVDSDIICASNFLKKIIYALQLNPEWFATEATVIPIRVSRSPLWEAPAGRGGGFCRTYRIQRVGFDEHSLLQLELA